MSAHKGSVAESLVAVYCIVLSVWTFWIGYALSWLVGVPLGAGAYLVVRSVRRHKERGK